MEPEALADRLVDEYKSSAKTVVFLSELMRSAAGNHLRVPENYKELLWRFNGQVRRRCGEAAPLIWSHLRRIGETDLAADGVHMNYERGQFRLFLGIRMAIVHAIKTRNRE